MIKHLGESLTPFDTQGFSRIPELPLTGDNVSVICRVDDSDCIPSLKLNTSGQIKILSGQPLHGHRYRFDLGAFEKPLKVSYLFYTQNEETAWFTFDVLTQEEQPTPVALLKNGQTVTLCYGVDIAVSFCGGKTLQIVTEQGDFSGSACDQAALYLPEGFLFEISEPDKNLETETVQ